MRVKEPSRPRRRFPDAAACGESAKRRRWDSGPLQLLQQQRFLALAWRGCDLQLQCLPRQHSWPLMRRKQPEAGMKEVEIVWKMSSIWLRKSTKLLEAADAAAESAAAAGGAAGSVAVDESADWRTDLRLIENEVIERETFG